MQKLWDVTRIGPKQNIAYENTQFPVESFDVFAKEDVPRWNCNQMASKKAVIEIVTKIGQATLISHSQSGEFVLLAASALKEKASTIVLVEPASFPSHTDFSLFKGKRVLFIYGDHFHNNSFWGAHLNPGKRIRCRVKTILPGRLV